MPPKECLQCYNVPRKDCMSLEWGMTILPRPGDSMCRARMHAQSPGARTTPGEPCWRYTPRQRSQIAGPTGDALVTPSSNISGRIWGLGPATGRTYWRQIQLWSFRRLGVFQQTQDVNSIFLVCIDKSQLYLYMCWMLVGTEYSTNVPFR
jgi:hypothetical protein